MKMYDKQPMYVVKQEFRFITSQYGNKKVFLRCGFVPSVVQWQQCQLNNDNKQMIGKTAVCARFCACWKKVLAVCFNTVLLPSLRSSKALASALNGEN